MKKISSILLLLFIGSISYAQNIPPYVPLCDLVAWYPFTRNTIDSTWNGNNGINYGATLTTDRYGHPNSAYSFNGTSDYIYIPRGSGLNSLNITGSVSVSAWVKSSNYSNGGSIFWRGNNLYLTDQYKLHIPPPPSNDIYFERDIGTGTTVAEIGYPFAGIDSFFHHFVGTYDSVSGYMSIYYDGNLAAQSYLPGIENYPTDTFFGIIGAVNYSPSSRFFEGTIDDIGVWKRALTPCEVNDLYHSIDICNSAGTITGAPTVCVGATINLTDAANGGVWSISNGNATISGAAVTGVSAGMDTISYIVTSPSCGTATATAIITINPIDTAYSHKDTSVCIGLGAATLTAPAGYISYTWSTGNTTISIVASSAGAYIAYCDTGCNILIDTFYFTLTANDTANSHMDTNVCAIVGSIMLNGPPGYNSYIWSTGNTASFITVTTSGK